jgi:hypothetical protein
MPSWEAWVGRGTSRPIKRGGGAQELKAGLQNYSIKSRECSARVNICN